jgi:C4-dicarboxylate-specific signal transduction histidine kinase
MISLYERVTGSIIQTMNAQQTQEIMKLNALEEKEKISFIINDTEKLIAESKEGVDRISKIVVALKKFSKVEDGQIKYIDINEEIHNVLTILNSETSRKGCKVNLNLNGLPKLRLESHGLNQVFSNLIINSLQAVAKNEGVIDIDGNVDGDNLVLFFKDNGSGISEENLKKVFNPFFTTKNIGEGAGLGLAISYGIIKKHNGNILVQSQVGKGTTFKLVIPIQERINYAS